MKRSIINYLKGFVYGALVALAISFSAEADYTISWIAPTENTDDSPLTDLAGYNLWCIPVDRTYGTPQVFGPEVTEYYKFWPSPAGDWKCAVSAFNAAGTESVKAEIFFTLEDLNGDGNPDVVGGADPGPVVVPPPVPDPTPDPIPDPVEPGERGNEIDVTRKGYWTIIGPDGALLQKGTGEDRTDRQVTSVVEAIEWITKDGRTGVFTIQQPNIEVEYQ